MERPALAMHAADASTTPEYQYKDDATWVLSNADLAIGPAGSLSVNMGERIGLAVDSIPLRLTTLSSALSDGAK
jgi:hypothetical protein